MHLALFSVLMHSKSHARLESVTKGKFFIKKTHSHAHSHSHMSCVCRYYNDASGGPCHECLPIKGCAGVTCTRAGNSVCRKICLTGEYFNSRIDGCSGNSRTNVSLKTFKFNILMCNIKIHSLVCALADSCKAGSTTCTTATNEKCEPGQCVKG